jgi:hypothetical protein
MLNAITTEEIGGSWHRLRAYKKKRSAPEDWRYIIGYESDRSQYGYLKSTENQTALRDGGLL